MIYYDSDLNPPPSLIGSEVGFLECSFIMCVLYSLEDQSTDEFIPECVLLLFFNILSFLLFHCALSYKCLQERGETSLGQF